MRFEEQGVITYRKHWAVLIRQIGPPTFLISLLLALSILRSSGIVQMLSLQQTLVGAIALLIPIALWWIYRYIDWANDIYQITPTQIVDISKKPLAREVHKVAHLENILGTEVDRKGLLGLLLNYGSVVTNVGAAQFSFQGIFDPEGVQQEIVRAQEAFLERQAMSDRRQRREEVVEWLAAYHDEVARDEEKEKGSGG
jgi:hypothetical protein